MRNARSDRGQRAGGLDERACRADFAAARWTTRTKTECPPAKRWRAGWSDPLGAVRLARWLASLTACSNAAGCPSGKILRGSGQAVGFHSTRCDGVGAVTSSAPFLSAENLAQNGHRLLQRGACRRNPCRCRRSSGRQVLVQGNWPERPLRTWRGRVEVDTPAGPVGGESGEESACPTPRRRASASVETR